MNLNFWIIQAFNGISYGALLFLVGSGLSLIFGVMRIVNLSHGSYFLLGGYVDRVGRRRGLMVTLGIMACGTVLIAFVPGYATIG